MGVDKAPNQLINKSQGISNEKGVSVTVTRLGCIKIEMVL